MKILFNWIIGVHEGKYTYALESNLEILKIQKEIFPENSYSIAESHYCNAVFYFNLHENEFSVNCARKAKNIMLQRPRKDRKRLEELIEELLVQLEINSETDIAIK